MGGVEATGIIRKFEEANGLDRLPIVALTAHAMLGDREKCIEAGMGAWSLLALRFVALNSHLSICRRLPHQATAQTGLALHHQQDRYAAKGRVIPAHPDRADALSTYYAVIF